MHRALVDEDRLLGRLDPDETEHCLIGKLRLARSDNDPNITDAQTRRWTEIHLAAAEIWSRCDEAAVGQGLDNEVTIEWCIARYAGFSTQCERNRLALPRGMRSIRRFRSTITPMAALVAPLASKARSMPVVSESPPAPGLSCVSAMTTGLRALVATFIA